MVAKRIEDTVGAFMPMRNTSTRPAIYGSVVNYLGDLVPNAGEVLIRSLTDGSVVAHTRSINSRSSRCAVFDARPLHGTGCQPNRENAGNDRRVYGRRSAK